MVFIKKTSGKNRRVIFTLFLHLQVNFEYSLYNNSFLFAYNLFRSLEIFFRVGAQENFQRPTKYISVDDDQDVIKDILRWLDIEQGSIVEDLLMDVTVFFSNGPAPQMICFQGEVAIYIHT